MILSPYDLRHYGKYPPAALHVPALSKEAFQLTF